MAALRRRRELLLAGRRRDTGSTLALAAGDVGSTFRVRVTATNAGGDADATSAPTVVVVPDPPVNTVLPVIAGTVRDGRP